MKSSLTDVRGIGPAATAILADNGLATVRALAKSSVDDLSKIPGFGPARAIAVIAAAAAVLEEAAEGAAEAAPEPKGKKKAKKDKAKKKKDKKSGKKKDKKSKKKKSKK